MFPAISTAAAASSSAAVSPAFAASSAAACTLLARVCPSVDGAGLLCRISSRNAASFKWRRGLSWRRTQPKPGASVPEVHSDACAPVKWTRGRSIGIGIPIGIGSGKGRRAWTFAAQCSTSQSAAETATATATTTGRGSRAEEGSKETTADDVAVNQASRRRSSNKRGGHSGGGIDGTSSREDVKALRLKKVAELQAAGIEPFAYSFRRTHLAEKLHVKYKELESGEEANEENDKVSVAGRVMSKRVFGKLAFITIRDDSGIIQLYFEKQRLDDHGAAVTAAARADGGHSGGHGVMGDGGPTFSQIKGALDVGDIIGAHGTMKRTEKGELSVLVREYEFLTKSLLPLPDKWHGLTDVEKRYRQRYVDLIINPGVADVFRTRAKVTSVLRRFMEERHFLEVETPMLQAHAGGADARPFITHHNALAADMYLRIATELYLKRMVVGGFERVFEIGRIFRNEGISTRHNPEFTSVEAYQAYADYNDMIVLTEDMVKACAMAACGKLDITYQGEMIDLSKPWRRVTMHELVKEATGVDFEEFGDDLQAARSAAAQAVGNCAAAKALSDCPSVGHVLNEVFEALVEKTLVQPTFVLDHPIEISPLAKPHRSRKGVVERFELFVCGRELANSFSELTDPIDQRRRLEAQVVSHNQKMRAAAAEAAKSQDENTAKEILNETYDVTMDDDFVTALEYGMPPTAGMGLGIDRLVMLLTDSASIRDVIAFPILKSQ